MFICCSLFICRSLFESVALQSTFNVQRSTLFDVFSKVGKLHVALACQRVVHGEGGRQIVTGLTHLRNLQVVPKQLLVVGVSAVFDDALSTLDGALATQVAIPCSVTMILTSCSELS